MLDTQYFLQHHDKNAKGTKFLLKLAFYTSKGCTCKSFTFYYFWFKFYDKLCSPYPVVYYFLSVFNHQKYREIHYNIAQKKIGVNRSGTVISILSTYYHASQFLKLSIQTEEYSSFYYSFRISVPLQNPVQNRKVRAKTTLHML